MKLCIGIDDSGRGPIIGPMIMAGILVNEKQKQELKKAGAKDSKQLLPEKRQVLYEKIKNICLSYEILAISPTEIDGRASVGLNLNKIEAIKTAEIINTLVNGILNLKRLSEREEFIDVQKMLKDGSSIEIECYVDCPSSNIVAWQNYLNKHIKKFENINLMLKCEHKADVNHVECSAASILAKVTRDSEIEKIKRQIGFDFGSGYPSDPVTMDFLEKHSSKFKHDGIFRKTWSTWQEHEKKKEQKKLGEFNFLL
ncbi:MAG: ribonuclease HII [Candidatus Pacearchaeota archaeon]